MPARAMARASISPTGAGAVIPRICPIPIRRANEGGALRAQDIRAPGDPLSLSGTLIRVDRQTGLAAPGNPRFATPGASENERRVVGHGLRNPFRFTIQPDTGSLWIGDVGWSTWEEIDQVPPDPTARPTVTNFGWPCYEGNCPPGRLRRRQHPAVRVAVRRRRRRPSRALLRLSPLAGAGLRRHRLGDQRAGLLHGGFATRRNGATRCSSPTTTATRSSRSRTPASTDFPIHPR